MRHLPILALTAALYLPLPATAATPIELLAAQQPTLAALYNRYPQYHDKLSSYANRQNFTDPIENLTTVVHELIHIDSAINQGYLIGTAYYDPYLNPSAWTIINNKDLGHRLTPSDKTAIGAVYSDYLKNTPRNTLGNVVDEINAYAQTLPYLCKNAPHKASRHADALAGHLTLADAYLRILANHYPDQYRALTTHKPARGALETVIANAYTTLNTCTNYGVQAANPASIPKTATKAFAAER